MNIFVVIRLFRIVEALRSCVADSLWNEKYARDKDARAVKDNVNNKEMWDKALYIMELVFPLAMIVKLGDFSSPTLCKLVPQLQACEKKWKKMAQESEDEHCKALAVNILEIVESDDAADDSDDEYDELESGARSLSVSTNRWQIMFSDIAPHRPGCVVP